MQEIKCLICNKKFKQVTSTHLKKEHNITMQEYKIKFPNCVIYDEKFCQNIRTRVTKWHSDMSKDVKESISGKISKKHIGLSTWNKGLTASNDSRVKDCADNLKNKSKSLAHKKALSIAKTKHQHYNKCIQCGVDKTNTTRKYCVKCAQNNRVKEPDYVNSMAGKHISEEHKKALWGGWKRSLTKPEIKVLNSHSDLTYTGDGKMWIKFLDGKNKNPDIKCNDKKFIEVYGDYWHKGEESKDLVKKYNDIGLDCLVLWEKEINKMSDGELYNVIQKYIQGGK